MEVDKNSKTNNGGQGRLPKPYSSQTNQDSKAHHLPPEPMNVTAVSLRLTLWHLMGRAGETGMFIHSLQLAVSTQWKILRSPGF